MIVKLKKEYLSVWLKRLASVGRGSDLHDICKAIYVRLDNDVLTLIRTWNGRSFAVIRTNEIEEIEDTKEPLEALIPADKFNTIISQLSEGIFRIGLSSKNEICFDQDNYKGVWKQKGGKANFPLDRALSFISDISEIEADASKTVNAKQFVEAVKRIKYAPFESCINPKLKNVVFKNGKCWALNHYRYHEIELADYLEMDLVLPKDALSVADFIHLSGVKEFSYFESESHYFFVVGDDLFIMEKNGSAAEVEKEFFLSKCNKSGLVKFNLSSKKLLEAVERIGLTANGGTCIAVTCQNNKIILESKDKLDNYSMEVLPVALSGEAPKKFIKWDSLAESLNSVSPLDIEVRINDKSMVIRTDKDMVVLSCVEDSK